MRRIETGRPDDFHVHLRQGDAMAGFARDARDAGFARVLAMPNLKPPITGVAELSAYRAEIRRAAPGLEPLMSFALAKGMRRADIAALKEAGAVAGKYYPANATTNSEEGIADHEDAYPALEAMEELGIVLSVHAEEPSAEVLDRERAFLPRIEAIAKRFPALRIVVEHLSSADGVAFVLAAPPTVAGGVTVHHLLYTLDDLMGGALDPQLHCKPCLKTRRDREAIQQAVLSGDARFFFGSDSAPHPRERKECGAAASGTYTMPVALPLLAEFFSRAGKPELLDGFVARHGADFYGLPRNAGTIALVEEEWTVPAEIRGVAPLRAGKKLGWRMESV